jgi:hypothetical protein
MYYIESLYALKTYLLCPKLEIKRQQKMSFESFDNQIVNSKYKMSISGLSTI